MGEATNVDIDPAVRSKAESATKQLLARGVVLVDFGLPDHLTRVLELMRSYRDVPASLADACLVCMAEEKGGSRVFTTDSDFRTYRKNKRQVIPVIMP